ncbi:hypothetical protein BDM02DRAFT_3107912 [Thelephora ganbajun]|uniref:Uncharacterized protein n=1 Tax=Thelephora ganbajun TaxID=370292 RepID=A0ACB6ZU47_THEGA|nr:hypothetical protein BDM02DRAFT_3107912 [Thelephora ganbajun]
MRRIKLTRKFSGFEGQLRPLSEKPGLRRLADHTQYNEEISRLLQDIRDAITGYHWEIYGWDSCDRSKLRAHQPATVKAATSVELDKAAQSTWQITVLILMYLIMSLWW